MKKVLFFFFIVTFFSSEMKGQGNYIPFPTDSSQWSVRHTVNNPFSQNSMQYKLKGDTILNGRTFHKMYISPDLYYGSTNQTLDCFIREDLSKKVFVKYPAGPNIDTSEYLLYDFGLQVGDTVSIKLRHYITDSVYQFTVTSKDSVDLGDGYRAHWFLQLAGSSFWYCGAFGMEWYEGIGTFWGVMYNEIPENGCDDGGYEGSCFWNRGTYIIGGTYCDYSTGIKEISDPVITFLPNPLTDISEIKFPPEYDLIEIYNSLGDLVFSKKIKNESQLFFHNNNLPSGPYICLLTKADGTFSCQKFIIQ
jgi:hypothetical protein